MDWNDQIEHEQEHDPLTPLDKQWLAHDDFKRPAEVLGQQLATVRADLELANERIFFLTSELAAASVRLGNLNYQTQAK